MILKHTVIALGWLIYVAVSFETGDLMQGLKIPERESESWSRTALTPRNDIKSDGYNDLHLRNVRIDPRQASGSKPSSEPHSVSPVPHVEHHHHGEPILETNLLPEERAWWENFKHQKSYFNGGGSSGWLWAHIVLVWGAFLILYPLSMVLDNVKRFSFHLVVLVLHSTSIAVGVLSYWTFMGTLPEKLYLGNVYHTMTFLLFVGNIMTITFAFIRYIRQNVQGDSKHSYCSINGFSSGPDSSYLYPDRYVESASHTEDDLSEGPPSHLENPNVFIPSVLVSLSRNYVVASMVCRLGSLSSTVFSILQWSQLFYFCIYMPTGIATFLVLGKDKAVFNLVAHFIKGGVFFLYGVLTLFRYCGAFSTLGWAWNHVFVNKYDLTRSRWNRFQSPGLCSMEMVESSLVLFYGSTNVFLEHLSNAGGAFSAMDLQHVSIAFIFMGCGVCGVLADINSSLWRKESALKHLETYLQNDPDSDVDIEKVTKATPGFSPNPFPVLTIFWTGYSMSKHRQNSMLSSEMHMLWGALFMFGCAFRLATYVMLINSPVSKSLTQPGQPFTELLVSFTLICGGLVLMESTESVVQTFELHGFTAMFVLNITLGMVTLFMGWQMSLMFLRDWLS